MSAAVRDILQDDPAGHHGLSEDEPLLGRRGDASQPEDFGIYNNLFLGTAILAQVGIWILVVTIWASVLSNDVILFSAHPLLNAAGILLSTQAILIVQPTHTPQQKQLGAHIHAVLNGTAFLSLLGGFIVIYYNKASHNGTHFESSHAIVGLTTYILLLIQTLVGFAQFYFPAVFGGVDNAKSIYKYHRIGGYLIIVLLLITVLAATQTGYNEGVLHLRLWAMLLVSVIILTGLIPRIKKRKLGL